MMTSSTIFTSISILLHLVKICIADSYLESHSVQFPLKNVQKSINENNFYENERNLSVGRCEDISKRYVVTLNLKNLKIQPPPNPYPRFIESNLVTCINLASNEIYQVIPGSFDLLPNLVYLDLSQNQIQFCDFFNFGSIYINLVTLVIEENKPSIDNIDKTISKANCFPKLRYLYLRKNSIRSLNFSLKKAFPLLTHLFLSDNNVDTHNFIHDLPKTLTHLYLERNLISTLDCTIIKGLQNLYLDENIIRSICYYHCQDTSLKMEGVHKLSILSLINNRITDIESCAFQDTLELMILNLAENSLENLKHNIFEKLMILKELNIDDNYLQIVPNLCQNTNLVILSLKRNKLQIIQRQNFKNLKKLKSLFLSGNQIKSIQEGSLIDLESLENLDLSYNELDFIPGDLLKWQSNLRTLDVRGNKFMYMEQLSLISAPFLYLVNLQKNPIVRINGLTISKLAPEVIINIQDYQKDIIYNKTVCYLRCNDDKVVAENETYSRWINNI